MMSKTHKIPRAHGERPNRPKRRLSKRACETRIVRQFATEALL